MSWWTAWFGGVASPERTNWLERGVVARARDLGNRLDINDITGRVANRLTEYRLGTLINQFSHIGSLITFSEAHFDTKLRQHVCE